MKKHRDADELAARIAAAANKPPVMVAAPAPITPVAEDLRETPSRQERAKAKPKAAKEPDENTVPISLRPGRTLLNRYIIAAAERTREAGRVVSAQQIMLEVLERGV